MNTHLRTEPIAHNYFCGDTAWARLHAERELAKSALARYANDLSGFITNLPDSEPADASTREIEWKHRELLQARLRQLDDAIDRVISMSYGLCSDCGKSIEKLRLAADPTVSTCRKCQRLDEPKIISQTL